MRTQRPDQLACIRLGRGARLAGRPPRIVAMAGQMQRLHPLVFRQPVAKLLGVAALFHQQIEPGRAHRRHDGGLLATGLNPSPTSPARKPCWSASTAVSRHSSSKPPSIANKPCMAIYSLYQWRTLLSSKLPNAAREEQHKFVGFGDSLRNTLRKKIRDLEIQVIRAKTRDVGKSPPDPRHLVCTAD